MWRNGPTPDAMSIGAAICACERDRRWEQALALLGDYFQQTVVAGAGMAEGGFVSAAAAAGRLDDEVRPWAHGLIGHLTVLLQQRPRCLTWRLL